MEAQQRANKAPNDSALLLCSELFRNFAVTLRVFVPSFCSAFLHFSVDPVHVCYWQKQEVWAMNRDHHVFRCFEGPKYRKFPGAEKVKSALMARKTTHCGPTTTVKPQATSLGEVSSDGE